ncbi:MAG: hypothetical protein RLY66_671 [Candidatus Parcubacteria bacterium]|jgi:murein DD-endopeptidase MepM/ murein hydrolase activator NlpD
MQRIAPRHPGYDYGYGFGTNVYAAEGGEIVTGGNADDCSAVGLNVAAFYMKHRHALIIKHTNDYCTVYMHLSEIDSKFADTSDPLFWKPKAAPISKGDRLGKIGKFLTNCAGEDKSSGYHLHFEVWRKEGSKWFFADPYGYQWGNGSNLKVITPYLWTQFR